IEILQKQQNSEIEYVVKATIEELVDNACLLHYEDLLIRIVLRRILSTSAILWIQRSWDFQDFLNTNKFDNQTTLSFDISC
ncbi:hypothetical protein GJ496_008573, partial [Pomphorhynchus laevis]